MGGAEGKGSSLDEHGDGGIREQVSNIIKYFFQTLDPI